jgi:hypothetical protein
MKLRGRAALLMELRVECLCVSVCVRWISKYFNLVQVFASKCSRIPQISAISCNHGIGGMVAEA